VYIVLLILLLPVQIIFELMKLNNKFAALVHFRGGTFMSFQGAAGVGLFEYRGPGDISTATGPG